MVAQLKLAVVIVNFQTGDLVVDCLHSLLDHLDGLPPRSRVVVVDGSSADDSVQRIGTAIRENNWSDRADLLELSVNGGFAFGNNRGVEYIVADAGELEYVLFLNPDTVVRPRALHELLSFMARTPTAGIAGSLLEDHDATRQACAFRFPSVASEVESEARIGLVTRLLRPWRVVVDTSDAPVETPWVSGASMMVRWQVFQDIGMFDEGYFLYYEEVDLCRRAALRGWECYHVPQSRVVHLVGAATGVTSRTTTPRRRPSYWHRSRQRYYRKHHGRLYLALADLGWVAGHLAWRAKQLLLRRPNDAPPYLLGDFIRHSLAAQWSGSQVN